MGTLWKRSIPEAVDKGLNLEFDEQQIEHLVVVGLRCCHPDYTIRPSIRQVINVLNSEAPLPNLPSKLPVPMYFAPPMQMYRFSYTSSSLTGSTKDGTQCSCSNCSTRSSMSAGSEKLFYIQAKLISNWVQICLFVHISCNLAQFMIFVFWID